MIFRDKRQPESFEEWNRRFGNGNGGGVFRGFIWGLAVGSIALYFSDPQQGRRRRVILRDKVFHWGRLFFRRSQAKIEDLRNRAQGAAYMARERLKSHGPVDDAVLEQRIRSHFGRKIRHARSVKVDVHEGQVVLSGPILRDEVGVLLDCVGRVPGVKGIENKLDVFDSAGQIPGLQGEGREYLQ